MCSICSVQGGHLKDSAVQASCSQPDLLASLPFIFRGENYGKLLSKAFYISSKEK